MNRRLRHKEQSEALDLKETIVTRAGHFGLSLLLFAASTVAVRAETLTPWVQGYNSKTRLVAGTVDEGGKRRVFAGVEIAMAPGWKTYWRTPGDSGGVPPRFDWSKSENLTAAAVRFPAPLRMKDQSGEAIGYKDSVILPIAVSAGDGGKPIGLALELEYGICREICVPAEAKLALKFDPATVGPIGPGLQAALARVPREKSARQSSDPALTRLDAMLTGAKPSLQLTVTFAEGAAATDVFAEASDGIFLPMPVRVAGPPGGMQRFTIDLTQGSDPSEIKGKQVTVTMVSDKGQSEATVTVE